MIYKNAEISKLFNEETIHVLDYEFEYDQGFPDAEKFPEFKNKLFSMSNFLFKHLFFSEGFSTLTLPCAADSSNSGTSNRVPP